MATMNRSEWFRYGELVSSLAIKDLKIKYKSATFGFVWALLNPLLLAIILTIVFSMVVKIEVEQYPLFLLVALFPWSFFSHSFSAATASITDNAHLIKKVAFPRIVIPLSVILSNLLHFAPPLFLVLILVICFSTSVSWTIIFLPLLLLVQICFVTGISLITARLHAQFRDVKFLVDASLIPWFYLTPILYPISMVPENWRSWYLLNPMAGIITSYRELLLEGVVPGLLTILVTCGLTFTICLVGVVVFRQQEAFFADQV